ncbi:uncharacterized protein LOC124679269 [Lolium rigidum]|uniref:uncharacterized protein LOC124679269 n=1 Tax=Lolium rigidum TaxID=89674 RepID=UPI001F5C6D0C|nr:uncharacterized protein LOC124679269 [Lolium rigidum]
MGDLSDIVVSWSVQEIIDDDLYRGQVETIPCTFTSLDHYLKSYRAPLLEETRSDLGSCLELIAEAPSSRILSVEAAGKSGLYSVDVDFMDNGPESYTARNGDIFILSNMKPEAATDFSRYGVIYFLAMVTEVSVDNDCRKGFKIKVPKDIDLEQDSSKLKHALFLSNIMTNMWIWKALCFDTHMDNNFTVIKSLLAPTNLGDDVCGICAKQDGDCLSSFIEQLLSISLNQPQVDAIRSVILAVQCKHMNLMKLIWGPPGAGKTKMVSALLWALACLKCRTLTCAPTNVAVTGVCTHFLRILKDFGEHIDEKGLPTSLGDVLLFGNKYSMDITEDLQEVFLDFRVEELVRCFSPLSGWKYRLASMVSFFEDCGSGSQYDMLFEDNGSSDHMCFSEFLKKQFDVTAKALSRCIMNSWIHLPGSCFSCDNVSSISKLFNILKKIDALLCDVNLTDESLKRGLGGFSTENSVFVQPIPFIEKELDGASSYRLHNMDIAPLDVLIVDEAAQVWECELVIPLRLHSMKHVVLVGDDCQLSAMVKSQVCKEAGFGTSLFQRLVMLNFEKYLLNIQYRMDPCISLFPVAQFYKRKIVDGPNVSSPLYNKAYTSLPFGSYTFINVVDGREDKEGTRNSWRNMVEVAVVLHLIQTIFKSWERSGQGLSIGVVSPYNSQVDEIKHRLGKKYDTCDGFCVRIKSIDGFQGQEDDVIILSTVRSNGRGAVGFLADNQRTNVALTRARHCLWIVGDANTLSKSGTVWTDIVDDAKRRNCIFSATNDATMCKLILKVKKDLDELDDLLNADSVFFRNTRWKVTVVISRLVILSDKFRKSFTELKSRQLRREVLQKLVKLGAGWRTTFKNVGVCDTFQLAKVWKVRDLYLVWSTDVEKSERRYIQIIRIWDLLSHQHLARTVQRLENLFSIYTDDYLDHCRRVQTCGKLEVPLIWDVEHDLVRYKKDCTVDAKKDHDLMDKAYAMENSEVTESFLLMKFYSLSSGMAKHLLTATDGSQINIPFELTDEEEAIIRFPHTSFILGRSGTGKTTILTMKLIQVEQWSLIASQGLNVAQIDLPGADDKNIIPLKDTSKRERFLKQVFITVSPMLCSAIKNHISRLKRFGSGDVSDQPSILHMHDVIDDLEEFAELPDKFGDLPCEYYPLTITYRKFLMMLDGTCRTSFFDGFYTDLKSSIEGGHSKSLALQTFIELKEVTYEKFVSSYWPHFNTELTKKLDASTVFTEIISHIKGGYQASRPSSGGKLERQDYLKLSARRSSSLNSEKRCMIYDIFLDYESMKCTAREFDLSDFVNSLHNSLISEGYNGDMVDFVYIDEVQDFTMAQIALLKYVCRNFKEGFVFAGDTAQTIAKGVDFRFEDIRLLFYTTFLSDTGVCNQGTEHGKQVHLSDMFQLSQNFRTHCGVLRMAQSIMNLLYFFFPSSVDKLNPESGLVHGEAPTLLQSGNSENAIMTIFGENKSEHSNLHGFGAEQVILVRDDITKKRVVDLVGKQALVLTIVECKGLEFQDVLLYNFFSSSPLRNKWRVVYGCMKEKDIIPLSEKISYPGFDRTKHYLLCSELKQLYVAVTRTRQRLWICENADDYCRPMFDYWKKLCLVQVRLLDSSFVQAMQTRNSSYDWRLQGIKLFNERQFEMAAMCFEKAGDTYREKWARAAGLLATADRVMSTNLETGQSSLQKASEIYESIGMHEKAASCYIRVGDYERAGMVYMQKCGTSRLEDAGDCYAVTECWLQAAEAYFKAKCYAKCFSTCLKGKLFILGLQFLQWLKVEDECLVENSKSVELSAIRKMYLENCAQHYFERGDIKNMMPFVKCFSSMDHVRAYLCSRNLGDELLNLEMEMGKFLEAAGIEKSEADILGEADMIEMTGYFEDATQLVLHTVVFRSLWYAKSMKWWPPHRTAEKEQFRAKANDMAKEVSACCFCIDNFGACTLKCVPKSLPILTCAFLVGRTCGNLLVELVAARLVLDVHLQSEASRYNLGLAQGSEEKRCCNAMLASDQISPETMLYVWNHWRSIIVNILSHLRHSDGQESNDCAVTYDDLCARYFGSSWQQDGNRCWLDSVQFHSFVQNFWMNELSSISLTVLNKLSCVQFSPEQASSYALGRSILIMYEIAMFLKEPEFGMPKSTELRSFFALCERRFIEFVSHVWRDGTVKPLLCMLELPTAYGLITDSLGAYLRPTTKKLTHGHLGRVTMFLLHVGQCTSRQSDDMLFSSLLQYLDKGSEWANFFQSLKIFICAGGFFGRSPLILNFKLALEFTFNANWMAEPDYISPTCYVDLIEFLCFFASSYSLPIGCVFCTKSILVKVLKCCTSTTYLFKFPSTDLVPDHIPLSAGRFIFQSVRKLLSNKRMIQEWFEKTSTSTSSYNLVLQRLVSTLYIVTLNLKVGDCYEVTDFLRMHHVFEDLHLGFSQKILYCLQMSSQTLSNFRIVFADALAAIGNRMVVMTSGKVRPIFRHLNADIISRADWKDIEKVLGRFCPEDYVINDEGAPFWEKFEEFRVNKHSQKDAWIIIQFLKSILFWLERRGPLKKMDPRLEEDVRQICNEVEERSARLGKWACVTANDLYSIWEDGEKKLQKIMRYLHSEKASMKKDCTSNAASAVAQLHAGGADELSGCSCKEADAGGNDVVESAKEEAGVAQASKQKQKSKKNPKKSKRHGKK